MANLIDEDIDVDGVTPSVSDDAELTVSEEEIIPSDDEAKPLKKKIAALKARHGIEDYFEVKKMKDALDYIFDENK